MEIQRGEEEEEIEIEPKPIELSTPLKIEDVNETFDREKEGFWLIEALIDEIINPAPGFVVDDDNINVDTQLDFQNSDLYTSFILTNTLQERVDNILENARKKVGSLEFPGKPTGDIANDPLYPLSQIETEDIYIDDSLRDMLYRDDPIYFPQSSTDDRKDFELNGSGDEMIVFKSPTLSFVTIDKKDLKKAWSNLTENIDVVKW